MPLFGKNLIPELLQSGRPVRMRIIVDRMCGLLAYNVTNAHLRLFLRRIILTKVLALVSILASFVTYFGVMMESHKLRPRLTA